MLFPPDRLRDPAGPRRAAVTGLAIETRDGALPDVVWLGLVGGHPAPDEPAPSFGSRSPAMPILGEHAHTRFTRPHLRGHRIADGTPGGAWSTWFTQRAVQVDGVDQSIAPTVEARLTLDAEDEQAGLVLRTEIESLVGGSLRMRHLLTNQGPGQYVVDGLEAALPVRDDLTEVLDFTGRHEGERSPQRHELTDGLWLREARSGRPGLDAATMVVVGTPGFTTTRGDVVGVHVAWSGNSVLRLERDSATATTIGGGELLLSGEVVLAEGGSYAGPWVHVCASERGLDGLADSWHRFQRALETHPAVQPVTLNVWEAVWFDHDLDRLSAIAERAADVGVERFVLDDGWFRHRRSDTAGLGDWYVDEAVWPQGLHPIITRVRGLGMQFGLWFEPEMVNPDSDLYRAHPDWVLSPGGRLPVAERTQQVLDLTHPDAWDYVFGRVADLIDEYAIEFVKWDHNRELLEAGSHRAGGRAAVHDQTVAFYRLLDALRERHPTVSWESCASGGGRIDLGVVERVERFWTSDLTDALARQHIQRWSAQLVAPEYLGAHVSSPTSHQTGRTLPLDFRAATALFCSFGIEWDLSSANADDLADLAAWVERYKRLRPLLHTGRVTRPESSDPAVLLHGVIATDGGEGLVAHVQLDESAHNRGVHVRVDGLRPGARYRLAWEGPVEAKETSRGAPLPEGGPFGAEVVSATALRDRGFWMPRRKPHTVTLVHLRLA